MARYEFDGRFAFPDQPTQASFAAVVQNYIDTHPAVFFGNPPMNDSINYHGTVLQHVQARFTNRQNLNTLFATLKTQAQNRGAIAPSSMWLKEVADGGGVVDGVESSAPGWADFQIT